MTGYSEKDVEGLPEEYVQGISQYYGRMLIDWHNQGHYSREDLVALLSDYKYFEEPAKGTFDSIVGWARREDLIDEELYNEIRDAVVESGQHVSD